MGRLMRHRQTKEPETDRRFPKLPHHISTLHFAPVNQMESAPPLQSDCDSEGNRNCIPCHISQKSAFYTGFEHSGNACRSSELITGSSKALPLPFKR
jgi:hypothetical protein